jgi:hypothetical protein
MAMEKNGNGSTQTPAGPKATKAELQKLFASYDAADKAVQAAEKVVQKALAARSAAVADICAKAGTKGPFKREDGRHLTGVQRVNKESGDATWYFKGPSSADVIDLA